MLGFRCAFRSDVHFDRTVKSAPSFTSFFPSHFLGDSVTSVKIWPRYSDVWNRSQRFLSNSGPQFLRLIQARRLFLKRSHSLKRSTLPKVVCFQLSPSFFLFQVSSFLLFSLSFFFFLSLKQVRRRLSLKLKLQLQR